MTSSRVDEDFLPAQRGLSEALRVCPARTTRCGSRPQVRERKTNTDVHFRDQSYSVSVWLWCAKPSHSKHDRQDKYSPCICRLYFHVLVYFFYWIHLFPSFPRESDKCVLCLHVSLEVWCSDSILTQDGRVGDRPRRSTA